jgi:hypothetical protein
VLACLLMALALVAFLLIEGRDNTDNRPHA